MLVNKISQRISLQEHLQRQAEDLWKFIDDLIMNDTAAKEIDVSNVYEKVFSPLLQGFKLEHPTDYFRDKPDNTDIVCSTQNEVQFFMGVLEIFGLPRDYLYGAGHWD